jgi:hypothetical protein
MEKERNKINVKERNKLKKNGEFKLKGVKVIKENKHKLDKEQ